MKNLSSQSFLIEGTPIARREETIALLGKAKINPGKISPDIAIISPLKTKVTINQIRSLKTTIFQKPVSLPHKVVIIEEAEKLTQEAQNALLKILEEPPASAIIILEAKDKSQILPTILSRVVTITAKRERGEEADSILMDSKNTVQLLEKVSSVESPDQWLDQQMLALYDALQKTAKEKRGVGEIENAIRQCALAKQMLGANVNPKHVLANLVLNLK